MGLGKERVGTDKRGGGEYEEKRHTIQDMPRKRICSWMDAGRIYSESPSDSMI